MFDEMCIARFDEKIECVCDILRENRCGKLIHNSKELNGYLDY